MTSIQRQARRSPGRPPLLSGQTITQFRWWSARQWVFAAVDFVLAFVVIGAVGPTLPPANAGRTYPVEWWNWVTLAVSVRTVAAIALASIVLLGLTLLLRLRAANSCVVSLPPTAPVS